MKYFSAVFLLGIAIIICAAVYYKVVPFDEIISEYTPEISRTENIVSEQPTENEDSDLVPETLPAESGDTAEIPETLGNSLNYRYNSLNEKERTACEVLLSVLKSYETKYAPEISISQTDIFTAWYSLVDMSDYVICTDPTMEMTYYLDSNDNVSLIVPQYNYNSNEYENRYSRCMSVVRSVVSQTEGMSDYDKSEYFHDYLVMNTEYNSAEANNQHSSAHSAYGCLVEGSAVCDGYAGAYKLLCNESGIPCEIVTGYGIGETGDDEAHAWNLVCLDGKWYYTDVTWDDPEGVEEGYVTYSYFNMTYGELLADHKVVDDMPLPDAYSDDMNYYVKNGQLIEYAEQMESIVYNAVSRTVSEGEECCEFRFADENLYYEAVTSLSNSWEDSFFGIVSDAVYDTSLQENMPFSYTTDDVKHIINLRF